MKKSKHITNAGLPTTATSASSEQQQLIFQAFSEHAPIGVLHTNVDWCTTFVNQSWLRICGVTREGVAGLNWTHMFYGDYAETIVSELHAQLTSGLVFNKQCQIVIANQEPLWVTLQAAPLLDAEANLQGFIAFLMDTNSDHIEAESKLREQAERDPLTQLPNRAALFTHMNNALERIERRGALALLSLDLDGFKTINDTMGHDAGDGLLIEVSNRVQDVIRHEDFLSRLGGDEFIIVLERIPDAEIASIIADKLLESLRQPFFIHKQEVFISVSIGICFGVAGQPITLQTLLKRADMALYNAKSKGKNNYQYYTPELDGLSKNRLDLINGLHLAKQRGEFVIHYQLQADVKTKKVLGLEALLRWEHPEKGIIPPLEFVHYLEEIGLVSAIGKWIMRLSFTQLREWIDKGFLPKDAVMSVNLSPRQFRDQSLVSEIEAALKFAELSGHNVVLEVIETTLMQENHEMIKVLQDCKALGVKIALDDFGTGYASLTHLKKFPIDILKVDRSFVKDILTDEGDEAITQAILAMAKALNLEVVAEGVDDEKILTKLSKMGCHIYQGYLLNEPMLAAEVETLLQLHE